MNIKDLLMNIGLIPIKIPIIICTELKNFLVQQYDLCRRKPNRSWEITKFELFLSTLGTFYVLGWIFPKIQFYLWHTSYPPYGAMVGDRLFAPDPIDLPTGSVYTEGTVWIKTEQYADELTLANFIRAQPVISWYGQDNCNGSLQRATVIPVKLNLDRVPQEESMFPAPRHKWVEARVYNESGKYLCFNSVYESYRDNFLPPQDFLLTTYQKGYMPWT